MRWIQCHRRHGALLALAALVLQIVLSFGHVHLHGVVQSAPAAITHPSDNDDYCAVCASIFLASSAFAPAPPQLPVPAKFQRVRAFLPCRSAVC